VPTRCGSVDFLPNKIDEILGWKRRSESERDTRFVELAAISAMCEPVSTGGRRN
jgi:hypothetical protein